MGKLAYYLSRIIKKSRLSSIANSTVHPTSAIESGTQMVGSSMDRHSFCGYECTLLNCDIGGFCSIADNVYIGGSHHPMHFTSTSPVFLSHKDSVKTKFAKHDYSNLPRTTIGHDVWIGHGAKIKAGVTVGHGAVIGMGTIVTKDVPPYGIVVGNPGRCIKKRFDDNVIEGLLETQWWSMTDQELRTMGPHIPNPEAFIAKAKTL